MGARLLCRTGTLSGRTHEVTGETVIGRAGAADVVIQSELISSRHARIHREGDSFVLEDLGSTNGTWLDGVRVVEPVRLDRLNVITFADEFDFIFQREAPAAPARAEKREAATGREPAAAAAPSAEPKPGTEVDVEAFGPLPELKRGSTPAARRPSDGGARTDLDMDPLALPELRRRASVPPRSSQEGLGTDLDMDPVAIPELKGPSPHRYALEVAFADGRKKTVELVEGRRYSVGRSPQCDIPIEDPEISRHHATVTVGKNVIVEDANSSNGTRVAGKRIQEATEIPPDSSFTLGVTVTVTVVRR